MKHYPLKARWSKLTPNQVRVIRAVRKHTGRTYKSLAQQYGVSISAIKDICLHYTYRYVTD